MANTQQVMEPPRQMRFNDFDDFALCDVDPEGGGVQVVDEWSSTWDPTNSRTATPHHRGYHSGSGHRGSGSGQQGGYQGGGSNSYPPHFGGSPSYPSNYGASTSQLDSASSHGGSNRSLSTLMSNLSGSLSSLQPRWTDRFRRVSGSDDGDKAMCDISKEKGVEVLKEVKLCRN